MLFYDNGGICLWYLDVVITEGGLLTCDMKKKILIIDDECDLCDIVKVMLTKDNYQVDCAHNLKEAADKILQNPEIILLDNNLPDGSGLDMLEQHPELLLLCKVIMMTADPRYSTKKRAAAIGLSHFIQKPFSINSIRQIVKTMD